MKGDSGRNGLGYILGTIHDPNGHPTGRPKEVCVVEMGTGAEICRVPVDQVGRFLLRSEAVTGASSDWVELRVLSDRGSLLGRAETSVPSSTAAHLRIMLDKPAAVPARSVTAPPRPMQGPALVAVGTLARMAEALKGRVPERDGRPQVPSWVNASIRELNTLAALGRRVLEGDHTADRAFLSLVGEHGRGFCGAPTESPSGAGMPMPFAGRPFLPRSPGAARGFGGPRSFGQPQSGSHPCIVDAAGVFVATAAGFMLDRWRADRLGDLTQPGALTRQTADLIKDRAFALEGFRDELLDGPIGGMGFSSHPPIGFGGDPGLYEPLDWPDSGSIPGGGGGFPCDFWVDCVDQIVDAASSYQPPVSCPREETIGSITPSAVCLGTSDVELEIRPVEGESFSASGVCNVWFRRSPRERILLETISAGSKLVRVRLKEATTSGCVGFRGAGTGTPGNMAFIDSCFRMAGLSRYPVLNLVRAAFDSPIACTGRNRLDVVPPPRLVSLHVFGPSGGDSGTTAVSLVEEGCLGVFLRWTFDFGSQSGGVDPNGYIKVTVLSMESYWSGSDGTVVAQNLPPNGGLAVSERSLRRYVVRAEAVVGDSNCGQTEGTIRVERVQVLELTGPASLQVGLSANVTVGISCPALSRGLTVSLLNWSPGRLQIPLTVVIPEGEDSVTVPIEAIGTGCGTVILEATAPGHLSASLEIRVFRTPTLDSIAPQTVQACRTFNLGLTGSCFEAGETVVRAAKAGAATRTLFIQNISGNSIQCRGNNFMPGSWTVTVTSRGLQSNAQVLSVQAIPAEIIAFNAWRDPDYAFNHVVWNVKDAVRIVIQENGAIFVPDPDEVGVELPGCGGDFEDYVTRLMGTSATYRLEAFPVGTGPSTIREVNVNVSGVKSLTLQNNRPEDLVVWKIEWQEEYWDAKNIPTDHDNKTDLPEGEAITLTFADNVKYLVVAIDKQAAIDQGKVPEGDAIQFGNLRVYEVGLVGDSDGDEYDDEISN